MNIWRKVEQLEARIAELERIHSFSNIIGPVYNGETEEKIDECVAAFEEAYQKGILIRPTETRVTAKPSTEPPPSTISVG